MIKIFTITADLLNGNPERNPIFKQAIDIIPAGEYPIKIVHKVIKPFINEGYGIASADIEKCDAAYSINWKEQGEFIHALNLVNKRTDKPTDIIFKITFENGNKNPLNFTSGEVEVYLICEKFPV